MPINDVPNALPNPPMHKPDIILDDVPVAYVPTVHKPAVDDHKINPNRKRGTYNEMTTMSKPPASTINDTHMQSHPFTNESMTDRAKLAEMQIAKERRRQRAVMENHAEQERRADDPNIFNNHVYEPKTKMRVVHERKTKSHKQTQNSDPID